MNHSLKCARDTADITRELLEIAYREDHSPDIVRLIGEAVMLIRHIEETLADDALDDTVPPTLQELHRMIVDREPSERGTAQSGRGLE